MPKTMKILEQRQDYQRRAHVQDGVLYVDDRQRVDDILAQNAAIRAQGGAPSCSFGKLALSVPLVEWVKLTQKYPGLVHGTPQERKRLVAQIAKEYPQFSVGAPTPRY